MKALYTLLILLLASNNFIYSQEFESTLFPGFGFEISETSDGFFISSQFIIGKINNDGMLSDSSLQIGDDYFISGFKILDDKIFMHKSRFFEFVPDTSKLLVFDFELDTIALIENISRLAHEVGSSPMANCIDNSLLFINEENITRINSNLDTINYFNYENLLINNIDTYNSPNKIDIGFRDIFESKDSSIIISVENENKYIILKTDYFGNYVNSIILEDEDYDYGMKFLSLGEDGYVILGQQSESNSESVHLLSRFDSNFSLIWNKLLTLDNSNGGLSALLGMVESTNSFYITGFENTFHDEFSSSLDLLIYKLDFFGDTISTTKLGTDDLDESGFKIINTNDDCLAIIGASGLEYQSNVPNVYIYKFCDENIISSIPIFIKEKKLVQTINLLGQEVKHQTNQPIIEIFNDGSVEKKVIIE